MLLRGVPGAMRHASCPAIPVECTRAAPVPVMMLFSLLMAENPACSIRKRMRRPFAPYPALMAPRR
ncbi:hypothetical protein B7802_28040 [Salmonella enterica]|nr:hypothetical protein [Salmonella enterica]